MSTKKVLVTGGNGHLGNTLAKELCRKGYDVRVTVRNTREIEDFGIFDGYDVEIRKADIRDKVAMNKALKGVEGVFQVAALYNYDEKSIGEGDGIVENNTDGASTVLQLSKKNNVERVVMTSSIVAVGFGGTKEQPMTEENWSDPVDPYCRSKLESEKAAWNTAREEGLDLITICPGLILGPNFYKHTASTQSVSAFVNNQVPFRFSMPASIVDVRDVALAHILAFENKNASGRYLASGSTICDLIALLKENDPEMVIPVRELSQDEAKMFAEKSGSPLEMIGQSFLYSDKKIRSELGWTTRPVSETIKDTVQWIKQRGL